MATVSMRRMTLSALAFFALGAAGAGGACAAGGAGAARTPVVNPVYAVVQGKSLAVQPAPWAFTPFAEVKDVHMYRATEQVTGATYLLATGNMVCHSAFPDSTVTVEVNVWITDGLDLAPRGTYSVSFERPGQGKAIPFSILCSPVFPEADRERWIKNGWKTLYTISLRVSRFVPKL